MTGGGAKWFGNSLKEWDRKVFEMYSEDSASLEEGTYQILNGTHCALFNPDIMNFVVSKAGALTPAFKAWMTMMMMLMVMMMMMMLLTMIIRMIIMTMMMMLMMTMLMLATPASLPPCRPSQRYTHQSGTSCDSDRLTLAAPSLTGSSTR